MEDALGNRWKGFEVGDRNESTFLRLLERLLDAARYSSAHMGGLWLLAYEHTQDRQGRGGEQERGLRTVLRGKLNRLVRCTKGCSKTCGMLILSLALMWLKLGWDLANLHVENACAKLPLTPTPISPNINPRSC